MLNPNKLLDHFQNELEQITDAISEVVEIESPSRNIGGNQKVVEWIETKMREIFPDAVFEKVFAENFGTHLIIRLFASDEKPVLLLGHTDTVHPIGTKNQNPTRIEDGKLYGCGTFDMKANIALMLEVFRAMKKFGLNSERPINILLACDEEIGSPTGREIVEREAKKVSVCYVFEPSAGGKVKTGRKGTGMFTLKAHGIPAHAGLEPEKGASAILEISRQIEVLHSLNAIERGTTVNVCTIEGGTTSNVIPENASCEIDVRFTTISEAKRIENEIENLKPFDKNVSLKILGAINRPPLERTESVVELFKKAQTIAASFDYEIGETQVGGASDGNFVGALGIPLLDGLGIAGNGAHTLEEYVLVDDIPNRATLLTLLLSGK